MNVHEFAELSAGHALGALSADDERLFRDALEQHPEWASIVDADVQTAASLAESAFEVAPPVAARSQLLNAIRPAAPSPVVDEPESDEPESDEPESADAESADVDPDDAESADAATSELPSTTEMIQTVQRRNWTKALFGLVASMVLLVGVGWVAGSLTGDRWTPAAVLALEEIEAAPDADSVGVELDDGGAATAHWSDSLGRAVLVSHDLPEIGADQTYELWFVRGEQPISAGTFESDGGPTTVELAGQMQAGDTIAVTVEPDGGAPEGVPTSDPIVVIPTA